jgi:glycosyltransferase involved in cell wall biosynthesis
LPKSALRILHVTPFYFSEQSVIGGGERYVNNLCAAVGLAAQETAVRSDVLSFGSAAQTVAMGPDSTLHVLAAHSDHLMSCAGAAFDALIDDYDVVHIHQCLLPFGFFVAARARMAGKLVIGTDHGGGESPLLEMFPVVGGMYDCFHAQSHYAAAAFTQMKTPVAVIRGPVDDLAFPLDLRLRDPDRIVAIGRILPHKGFEEAIDALPPGRQLTIIGRKYDDRYFDFLQGRASGKHVAFETALDDAAVKARIGGAGLFVHTGLHRSYDGNFHAKPELLALTPLEAMCCGTPAVVSGAGALPELACLDGCRVYADRDELAQLMRGFRSGAGAPGPADINADVVAKYGLKQFGLAYLGLIERLIAGR